MKRAKSSDAYNTVTKKILTVINAQFSSSCSTAVWTRPQLFESLDPFPFREKDLNKKAEEFIVSWARELPLDQPLTIVVHIPKTQASSLEARELGAAVNRYFRYRAQVISLELNELFRVGWQALAIGLTVLSICVVGSQTAATNLSPLRVSRVIQESLTILGWVGNWNLSKYFYMIDGLSFGGVIFMSGCRKRK